MRQTVNEIGYNDAKTGFDGNTCAVMVALDQQSPDIAMGVDKALEAKEGGLKDELDTGARRSGYDVRLCDKRDTGAYAVSDFSRTQAGITADQGAQGRHTFLSETGRKDTGFPLSMMRMESRFVWKLSYCPHSMMMMLHRSRSMRISRNTCLIRSCRRNW